ncbi:MAG: glutamyl-tRNA reductase [Sphingobacteriales bacterium]
MEHFHQLSFTHKHLDFRSIGLLVLDEEQKLSRLEALKERFELKELFYLSTCNRVEIGLVGDFNLDCSQIKEILTCINPTLTPEEVSILVKGTMMYRGIEAHAHFFRVSCSLDSMVIGEKEIFGQFKSAYSFCKANNFSGDTLRLLMKGAVQNAKEIYSQTEIARKPVSIVSLAFRQLRDNLPPEGSRVLFIGAGETNRLMSKYLIKHGNYSYAVFNRTLNNAQSFADEIGGKAFNLDLLREFTGGFDIIISCTASAQPLIDLEMLRKLKGTDTNAKFIVDLAIPNDVVPEASTEATLISINHLKKIAAENLNARRTQLTQAEAIMDINFEEFKQILRQRKIELAMREVPTRIKQIKANAINEVFANELTSLDPGSREVLDKVLNYMEKKYISVPMVMARDILLDQK